MELRRAARRPTAQRVQTPFAAVGCRETAFFQNLQDRPKFADLQLSKAGQIKREAQITVQLLQLTLDAWNEVSAESFSAAWATCGYIAKDQAVDLQMQSKALDPTQAWHALDLADALISRVPQWQVLRNEEWAVMPSSIARLVMSNLAILYNIYIYVKILSSGVCLHMKVLI